MWAGFAALGRSRLKHNWTAPVELTAVQPSPWLYRESTAPQENTQETNRERRAHPNTAKEEATRQIKHKQTSKQTNSKGDQLNNKKGGGR